jgi:LruC domain-containing protein
MKLSMNRTLLVIGILLLPFLFQSCDDEPGSQFDGNGIPSNFNYLTVKTIDIQIDVNDQFGGQYLYKVEIFDQNPLTSDTVVNLLAAGVANSTKSYTTRVVIPQYVSTLYVRQTDPAKKSVVKAVSIDQLNAGAIARCNFNPTVVNQVVKQKAAPVRTDKASDYVLPSTYTTITTNAGINAGAYYVPAGTTITNLTINWFTNIELYVAGTLIYNNNSNFPSTPPGLKLVLLPGSRVSFSQRNEVSFEQSNIVVAVHEGATLEFFENASIGNTAKLINDGTVTVAKQFQVRTTNAYLVNNNNFTAGTLDITNGGLVVNQNSMTLNNNVVMNSNATLVNNGTLEAKIAFTSNNQTTTIYNNHVLITPFFDFARGGGVFHNSCRIECEDFVTGETIINNENGALILCQDMEMNNTTFNLAGGSMIYSRDLGYNNVNQATYSGSYFKHGVEINGTSVGGVAPVFINWKIEDRNGSKVLSLKGTHEFVVSTGSVPGNKFFNLIEPTATISTSPVSVVPSTSCNLGGINNGSGGGGGVPPTDPSFPIQVVESTDYIYSMEDLWPHMGDYDMNDFVFKIHAITKYVNSSNRVEKMTFELTPLASGSTKVLTAALQLDGVVEGGASAVVSTLNKARLELGHTKANVILFENVHSLFGLDNNDIVNTFNNIDKIATSPYTFEITFASPVEQSAVSVDKLNFYSIVGEIDTTDRHEIHLAGYEPSSKVSRQVGSYKDQNNMVWALMLPSSSYKYPAENVKIFSAYPKFNDWARSGGKEFTDWYLNPSDSVELIYNK